MPLSSPSGSARATSRSSRKGSGSFSIADPRADFAAPLLSRVKTEADAEELADELSQIDDWNEDPSRGSCSISVNGAVVAAALTDLLPRTDPRFAAVRDRILAVLKEVAVATVLKTCETLQALPSQLFAQELY
ncbi:MAG: hypothetical protein ABS79_01495 [Planctomycetes bacterium SCN 63-9]|nr:MAG: hypothetical protein ABS79_01495 [Planctomycetes bacterium SCN 63-9]